MSIICGLLLLMDAPRLLMGQPTSAAVPFAFSFILSSLQQNPFFRFELARTTLVTYPALQESAVSARRFINN
jgi:hypothetical protein